MFCLYYSCKQRYLYFVLSRRRRVIGCERRNEIESMRYYKSSDLGEKLQTLAGVV